MARGGSLFLACLVAALSVSTASGFVFKAGGTGEWRVPAASNAYNGWAQRNRFRVGDAIAFTYQAGNDSVLLVDKRSYDACDTSSPIDTFSDGNTVFTFTSSGSYYFISGNRDNCNRNEKLVVVVMAERSAVGNGTEPTTGLAPSPNISPFSPSSPPPPPFGVNISPAANNPPPPFGVNISPAASNPPPPFGVNISPAANNPPPNAAAPKVAGVAGTAALAIGVLFYALA